jgi:hypothetical protein
MIGLISLITGTPVRLSSMKSPTMELEMRRREEKMFIRKYGDRETQKKEPV